MGSDEKVEQSSNVESALKDMCGAFGNELSRERMAAGVNTLLREVDARIAKAIQWSPVEVTKQWAQSAADANRLKVTREMFSSPRATDSTPVVTFTPVPSSPSSVRDAIGSFYGKHVVVTMKDGSKHQGVLRDYGVGGEVGIGTRSGISIADIVSVTTMGPCDEPIEATPEPLGHLGPARLRQLAEHHPKVRGELRWAADEIERIRALVPTGHKSWHDDRREVARLYRWLVNRDYFDDHDTAVFIEYPETFAAEYAEMCREQPYPSGLEAALTELTEEGHLEPDRALQWRASKCGHVETANVDMKETMEAKMDEKILELLGAVVQQNAELLKQNREVIDFLKERDADVPARNRVNLALEERALKLNAEHDAHIEHVNKTIGIGAGDLVVVRTLTELGLYDAARAICERLKAEGKLPEKSE